MKHLSNIPAGSRVSGKNIAAQPLGLGMSFRRVSWDEALNTPIRQSKGCTSLGTLEKEYKKKGNRKPRSYRSIDRMNKWTTIQKTWFKEPEEEDTSTDVKSMLLAAYQRQQIMSRIKLDAETTKEEIKIAAIQIPNP